MLSVSTSGVVMPAASLPDRPLAAGAAVTRINPVDVAMGEPKALMLIGLAGQVVPALIEQAFALGD
jgi:NAD-dependent deacetylase